MNHLHQINIKSSVQTWLTSIAKSPIATQLQFCFLVAPSLIQKVWDIKPQTFTGIQYCWKHCSSCVGFGGFGQLFFFSNIFGKWKKKPTGNSAAFFSLLGAETSFLSPNSEAWLAMPELHELWPLLKAGVSTQPHMWKSTQILPAFILALKMKATITVFGWTIDNKIVLQLHKPDTRELTNPTTCGIPPLPVHWKVTGKE